MVLKNEIWKYIPNTKKRYQISNLGRIRSLYRRTGSCGMVYDKKLATPKIMSQGKVGKYLHISLMINEERSQEYVHRLMLMTFRPRFGMKKLCVNHLDFDTFNNNLSNLRWATYKENINHSLSHGRFDNVHKERSKNQLRQLANGTHPFLREDVIRKRILGNKKRWLSYGIK